MFGLAEEQPQRETTPFHPRSPYAAAKAFAYYMTRNYREAYGMFAVNGILFNHESPRRGEAFVTRKITRAAARIVHGLQDRLELGNLDARRDWGFAGDYVEAMWRMLQAPAADDYVIATGRTHSVRHFATHAFAEAGLPLTWQGDGAAEQGVDAKGTPRVVIDPKFMRPTEVRDLCGDATKAQQELGWSPTVSFEELVQMMVRHDLDIAQREATRA
jgi:GDPmannose 4,6-dehydratase